MKLKKGFLFLFLIIIVVFSTTLLVSQTSKVPEPRSIPGTVVLNRPIEYLKGVYGGQFVSYDIGDPATFNDSQSRDNTSSIMISKMAPGLFTVDYDTGEWYVYIGERQKGSTGPGYDIVVNDDGSMEITAYLRKDVYWSDGTRMTADDWVYYWNEIISNDEIGHSAYNGIFVEVDGYEEEIVAERINRWTVKFNYPGPMGDPEQPLSYNAMPKHILEPIMESQGAEGVQQLWGIDTAPSEIISYGPWILENYEASTETRFKRNDRFFLKDHSNNRMPYLETYVVNVVSDMNAATLRFQNKEIDHVNFPNASFKMMVENAEAENYQVWNGGPTTGTLFVSFNQNENSDRMKDSPHMLNWFKDKRFRQAMNYMIDRATIIEQVLSGLGEPDKGFLHPASIYFNPENTFPVEYNPDKGLALLEEMEIRDRNGDGILEDANGNDVTFELVTNAGNNEREKVITIISNDWNTYGVNSQPTTIDFGTLVEALTNNLNWESVVIGLTGGLWPGSGINVWPSNGNLHLWNPLQESPATEWEATIDEIFKAARFESDYETRKALWDEMYTIIYEELPELLLYRKYAFKAIYNKWGNIAWDTIEGQVGGPYNERTFLKP